MHIAPGGDIESKLMAYEIQEQSPLLRARRFFAEAISDNDNDFTVGPIGRCLGLLAIPMVLEMSMESIFAIVDIAFVSRLGTEAIAAVGITEALITVLYAIAIGLGMGVTAMVSRRVGEKDHKAAARVTGQAIWLGAALSLAVGVGGVLFAEDLLRLMGAEPGVVETGRGFTAVLLGGSASILYLFLLNAAFRGAGDAPIALRSLALANGINIVLDPCLIFGIGPFPELGVTGAAVATTIGRGIGVAYLAAALAAPRGRLTLSLKDLAIVPTLIRRMIGISIGGVGQFLIATASWIVLMRIVATFGSAPVAAFTIALRTVEFALLPAWGLGNAAATLVGQNLGAGKPDRAEAFVWRATKYNLIFMTVTGSILVLFAAQIVGLFSSDADILRYGIPCLQIFGLGYPVWAVGMIAVQALNGAGDTRTPTVLNFVCFWILEIPLAWWLALQLGVGPTGVYWATVVAELALTVLSVIVFRAGHWKHTQA